MSRWILVFLGAAFLAGCGQKGNEGTEVVPAPRAAEQAAPAKPAQKTPEIPYQPAAVPEDDGGENGSTLVIADFDTGDKPNNLAGDFGGWDKDPADDTQGTRMFFASDDAKGDPTGYSVRLDYDVDSPKPAYNGFWMKLNGENATPYNTLRFSIKGDAGTGFTKRVKIELKDMSGKTSPYIVGGITDQWQEIVVPFEKFRRIEDWSSLNEFVLVFDDINSQPKVGTIYLDHVFLSKE